MSLQDYRHQNHFPRFARSRVSRRGKPISNGTSLGAPPLGIGKMSIGEKHSMSEITHVTKVYVDNRFPLDLSLNSLAGHAVDYYFILIAGDTSVLPADQNEGLTI
jgi:hypothetical protein